MADPLLEDNYPIKSLYQALAVAAMCLQEEAETRPLISDVVTAIEFLARKRESDETPISKETCSSRVGDSSENNEANEAKDDDEDNDNNNNYDDDDNNNNNNDNDNNKNKNENENEDQYEEEKDKSHEINKKE